MNKALRLITTFAAVWQLQSRGDTEGGPPACSPVSVPSADTSPSTTWLPDFSYNADAPLDVKEVGVRQQSGVDIHDLSFAGAATNRIKAYLVRAPSAGPFPGVLFVHWLGDPNTSNRSQFLNEAVQLAQQGFVCLLVDALWSDVSRFPWTGNNYAADRDTCVRQVKDLRRAIDLLASEPAVDGHRLGYVGHDFGAMAGAELAGADQRIKAYVIIAGTPRFRYWFFRWSGLSAQAKVIYGVEMEPIDPVSLIQHSETASFFFQFASRGDEWVSQNEALELYNGASGPKEIGWYDANHAMASPAIIRAERLAWLKQQLLHSGKFSAFSRAPSGHTQLTFLGDRGVRYRLQISSDFAAWHDSLEWDSDGSSKSLSDTSVGADERRFYRTVVCSNP
jgi:pimeloyl-ACP methyl ester carboxylesterase